MKPGTVMTVPWRIRQALSGRASLAVAATVFALALAGWWAVAHSTIVNPLFLPTPEAVLRRAVRAWMEGTLTRDIGISVYRVSAAFGLAAAMAIPLGILAGSYSLARAAVLPAME